MSLLEVRQKYGLSQAKASILSGVPLRTYIRYESDDQYGNYLKRKSMIDLINDSCEITESKGLLTTEFIKSSLVSLFDNKFEGKVDFCYLFGSYAKGYAKEDSDVDLCISTSLTGLAFVGLSEEIHQVLHKKIDLVRFSNLANNLDLINEIMKGGIKIYG